ncbi:MAG: PTS sugar transporter subunit IIB [Elusimicrobia bacterium]|nr:PTS sugar transporter subunit IIB [Elusimicrobiota bacterium]MBU2615267.1 PTS sugar transporter subunit IIB [Elusimicrobiota bacterium]
MAIILARIDDRLVHGQVIEGWLRVLNASFIIVVNDLVAADKMQSALYSISIPSGIHIECLTVGEAIKKFTSGYFEKEKVLALFSNPFDVLELIKGGVELSSVNVGGLHFSAGKQQIGTGLSLNDQDVTALREIAKLGVEVEGRVLPLDERHNVIDLIAKYYKNEKN